MIPAHRTPVLVGIGTATRREEDFERALEPMDLKQEAVAREVRTREVVETFSGEAKVAGNTVLHGRGQAPRGVAVVDTADERRAVVTTEDPALILAMQAEEFVGRPIRVEQNGWIA